MLSNDKRKEIAQEVSSLPGIFAPLCRALRLQSLWSWSGAAQDSDPHMYLVPAQKFLLWNQAVLTLQFLGDRFILHGWRGVNRRHRRRGRDRSHGRSRDKGWNGWGTHNTTHSQPLSAQQTPLHNKNALSRAAQAENKCHNTWRKLQPTATCKLQTFRELSYWEAFQEEITRHESFLQILQKKNTLSVWQAAVPAPPVREEKKMKKRKNYFLHHGF